MNYSKNELIGLFLTGGIWVLLITESVKFIRFILYFLLASIFKISYVNTLTSNLIFQLIITVIFAIIVFRFVKKGEFPKAFELRVDKKTAIRLILITAGIVLLNFVLMGLNNLYKFDASQMPSPNYFNLGKTMAVISTIGFVNTIAQYAILMFGFYKMAVADSNETEI